MLFLLIKINLLKPLFLLMKYLINILCLNVTTQRDLTPPYVDDGQIEIVGFRDAWHGLVLLTPKGHGTRLAQVST